jgi:hypothetical protein
MASSLWRFSTTRMLRDYIEKMYLPAATSARETAAVAAGEAAVKREATRAAIAATQGG